MARTYEVDERDSDTESKFYLPAGGTPPFDATRLGRIWARIFDHRI